MREAKKKKTEKKNNRMQELNSAQDSRKKTWVSFQNKVLYEFCSKFAFVAILDCTVYSRSNRNFWKKLW